MGQSRTDKIQKEMKEATICLNGMKREVPQGITLEEFIELLKLNKKSVVLELNRKVIDRNSYARTPLNDHDTLEIVHFVGGG